MTTYGPGAQQHPRPRAYLVGALTVVLAVLGSVGRSPAQDALVLSGGGSTGLAHAGVLEGLEPLGPLDVGFGANTDGGERFGVQLGARF